MNSTENFLAEMQIISILTEAHSFCFEQSSRRKLHGYFHPLFCKNKNECFISTEKLENEFALLQFNCFLISLSKDCSCSLYSFETMSLDSTFSHGTKKKLLNDIVLIDAVQREKLMSHTVCALCMAISY